jgi:hypothetical protein
MKEKTHSLARWAELYNVVFLDVAGFNLPPGTFAPDEVLTRQAFLAGMRGSKVAGTEAGRRYLRNKRGGR